MAAKSTSKEEKIQSINNNELIGTSMTKLTEFHDDDDLEAYEPWKHRNLTHPLGALDAVFHMVKSSLGSGILSMPAAFKNGGLWVGLGCAMFVCALYTHCVHILVFSSQVLCRRLKVPRLGYADIAEAAFLTGPPSLRRYASLAKEVVDAGLFFCYYSCCIVYVVFSASSLKQVVEYNVDVCLDVRLYIVLVTLINIPIGMIRNLKYLVPFSLLAICALVFSCGFVLYEVFQELPPLSSRPAFTSFDRLPLFFSTVIFAVDGTGTVLPIENAMHKPQGFLGCPGVLNVAMVSLMLLYCSMGFFGFLHYGDATQGSITLNIASSFMGQAVKILVTLNVLCSFGLFLYVPCDTAWRKLEPHIPKARLTFYYYTMRLVLVLGAMVFAATVPDLELFVSLVGALTSSTLVLFFPPLIELVTFWEDPVYMGPGRWKLYKNIGIIAMWLVTFVSGTRASLSDIIKLYQY